MPPAVTTVTSTGPACPPGLVGGDLGVGVHGEEWPAVSPKSTAVAPVKSVPVIVTEVPPAAGPLVGLRPVTVGRGDVGELVGRARWPRCRPGW